MMSSVIPARLQFQCGHAALVTLPRVKGETAAQRNDRVAREKSAALARQCDFCAPAVEVAVNGNHMSAADALVAEPIEALTVVVTAEPEPEPEAAPEVLVVEAESRPESQPEVVVAVEAEAEALVEAEALLEAEAL